MKKYFKQLRKANDFTKILPIIQFEDLLLLEEIIENYENNPSQIEDDEFVSFVIKWWIGLTDTETFLNYYIDCYHSEELNDGYDVIYPEFNENLSEDNIYELRVNNPLTSKNYLYYENDGFCKEFENLDEAYTWIDNNINSKTI